MKRRVAIGLCVVGCAACSSDAVPPVEDVMTTEDGVAFVRTPAEAFVGLADFDFEIRHVAIDGLRQAYVDEGPVDGQTILLLHGQPSWSYLYRTMIPVLVAEGHRVIAMDHLGMGASDKPTDIASYSYLGHIDRLEKFVAALGLSDITLFCQDWGSLIGLNFAGNHPDLFARIVVGNGRLPQVPPGVEPYPPVKNPDEVRDDLTLPFDIPPQQERFYDDACNQIAGPSDDIFPAWMEYSLKSSTFHPAEVLEALTWFDLDADVEAAYDAPFPTRLHMAGVRVFPSLVNELAGNTIAGWGGLTAYEKPFLTIWASNDPGGLGTCAAQDEFIDNVPGAIGRDHVRLPEASHFLQDDQGREIARRMNLFIASSP